MHVDRIIISILVFAFLTVAFCPGFKPKARYVLTRFAIAIAFAVLLAQLDWLFLPVIATGTTLGLAICWQIDKRRTKLLRCKSTFSKSSKNW